MINNNRSLQALRRRLWEQQEDGDLPAKKQPRLHYPPLPLAGTGLQIAHGPTGFGARIGGRVLAELPYSREEIPTTNKPYYHLRLD
jgi:hypothetical protein